MRKVYGGRTTEGRTDRHTYRQTYRQRDRQTDRQTDRRTDGGRTARYDNSLLEPSAQVSLKEWIFKTDFINSKHCT